MSKNDVVKPGHFKLAGKARPGQDIQPELEKQKYTKSQAPEAMPGSQEMAPRPGEQESVKAGVKSSARKEDLSRYGTEPYPSTRQVPGAFGKEGPQPEAVQGDKASEMNRAEQDIEEGRSRKPKTRKAGG